MAIKGSLKEASLPDVCQLLAMGQKTGCLSVTDRSNFGYVYFEDGRITYASILNRPDRLGELLVKRDAITRHELSAAMEHQARESGKRLGRILVEREAITEEQLVRFIHLQIEEAVYHLFTWSRGSFYFEVGQKPDEEEDLLVSINPENLLLEGARRVDEWSLIEKKIPTFDLIFAVDHEPDAGGDVEITETQRRVLGLLDGNRTVQDIVDETGMVEFEVGKALFGLIQAGFAERVGRRAAEESAEGTREAQIEEYENLGVAFYRTGMYDDARREFRKVAELRPSSAKARFYLGLIALREARYGAALRHLRAAVEEGGVRKAAFMNIAVALERLGRHADALLALDQAESSDPGAADVALSRAIVELKADHVAAAGASFLKYRERLGDEDPPARYYAYAMVAAAMGGELEGAEALGREGLEKHPDEAILHLHLGAVLERAGEVEKAETLYTKVLEEQALLPQGYKSLGDIHYRRGEYDEARGLYERAVELDPELGDDIYLKLGNIAYKAKERDRAVAYWERALSLNPENDVIRTNLELVESAPGS